jgi:uncharacterized membrane protein YgaE (UPF0421/DUF939 family)
VLARLLAGRDLLAELQLALKMSAASTLSWWLATRAGEPRPIFAALVPFVAMSGDPFSAVSISVGQIVGVFAGVAIGIGLLATSLGALAQVGLAVLAGALAGLALRVGGRANVQVSVSALFLIALGRTGAAHAGATRIWETAIGAGVTVCVAALLWPPDPVRELRLRLGRLQQELGADLAAIAEDLATGNGAATSRLDDVRARSLDAVRDVFDLERARNALRWNSLRRQSAAEFGEVERRIRLAARLYRHTRALTRDVADAGTDVRGAPSGHELAGVARAIAETADRELHGLEAGPALNVASAAVDASRASLDGEAVVVRAQLAQMLADLRPTANMTK